MTFQEIFPGDAAKWLIEEALKRGVTAASVLKGTGLGPDWLKDKDAVLDAGQYRTLVMNALRESRDPTLGLGSARQLNYLSRFGFWGFAILSSTYFGQASQMAIRYWDICGSLMRMAFRDEGDTCVWEFKPALRIDHEEMYVFAVEKVISSSFATIRFATGRPPPVREIRVTYSRPEHAFLYRDYWGVEVLFRQEKDLVRMDASLLKRPVLLRNPQIREVCRQQCRQLLFNLKRTDELVEVIRRIIIDSPGVFPDAKEAAEKLGMSPRTLRRRLQERNTSYRKLLDEVRSELATGYLTTTSLGINEIADLLGYAETSTFRRSFKKWVGKSATAVRKDASR